MLEVLLALLQHFVPGIAEILEIKNAQYHIYLMHVCICYFIALVQNTNYNFFWLPGRFGLLTLVRTAPRTLVFATFCWF